MRNHIRTISTERPALAGVTLERNGFSFLRIFSRLLCKITGDCTAELV